MHARQKLVAATTLLVTLLSLFLLAQTCSAPPVSHTTVAAQPDGAVPVSAALQASTSPESMPLEPTPREAPPAVMAAGRGDLVVRLLYGDDRSPAADVMVTAYRQHEVPRNSSAPGVDAKRRRTDAAGIARFPSMRAGRTGLIADRGHWYTKAYVTSGKETEVEFVMPVGVTVTGVVVSALGAPVAEAQVELESTIVTTTDAAGRFTLRGVSKHYSIGARAPGHGASKAQQILEQDGKAEVRLELAAAGGIVEGVVLGPDGKTLPNIRIDIGRYQGGKTMVGDAPPRPARPRTDPEGHFRAVGIHPGEQQLSARAPGCKPWSGTCAVTADATTVVRIVFEPGNTLRGTLRDADGRLTGDLLVSAYAGSLDWDEVIAPDGTFEITGLPDGEIEVKVDAEDKGEASTRVTMVPGGALTTCDLTLACGFVARGKVRDEAGQPVPRVNVRWQPSRDRMGYTSTDERGAFAIANTPEGLLSIHLGGEEIANARFDKLDPRAGELDLRVKRLAPKTAYIAGLVLDPEGRPATARAWASGGGSNGILEKTTDAAGYFEIGPVSPGVWHLVVETRSFPRVSFERHQLDANARWDVGTVRLAAGGDVQVRVVAGSAEGVVFSILDATQRFHKLDVENGTGTSELLPIGAYRLLASGKACAAQSVPFEIRAGSTTKLDVRLRPGVRQRFAFELPAALQESWGSLRIHRGADHVANAWANAEAGKPCTTEVSLDPGEYTVFAKFGESEGTATFTVRDREGEPVRIVVPAAPK